MIWYENPLFPEFDGKILMSVLKDKKIVAIDLNADGTEYLSETHYLTNQFGRLRDICEGGRQRIVFGNEWRFLVEYESKYT